MLLGLHADSLQAPGHHNHDHGDDYASASASFDAPMGEAEFRVAVSAWPPTVLRAKGIVHLADDPLRRYVFQLVGRRWSLTPDRAWGDDVPRTQLVAIGLTGQLDAGAVLASLIGSRATACHPPRQHHHPTKAPLQ